MKRGVLLSLVTILMVIFLAGFIPVGSGHPFIVSDNFVLSDGENVVPEIWSDSLEIYESETLDGRIWVNSLGIARWKVRWARNEADIIENLNMMIRVNGSGVDKLLLAEYVDGWWVVSYNHTEPALLEFSVYSVSSYGMTEFVQLAENVEIIWDRIVIITMTTNIDIITDITLTEPSTSAEFELVVFLGILGISIIIIVVVILYVIKKKW